MTIAMKVGTRELKNRLSHYLRQVRETGTSLLVTDRGEVVAELRPIPKKRKKLSDRDVLVGLAAKGELSLGTGRFKDFPAIKPKRGVKLSRYVLQDRR